jgi:alpha-tubulin suppressor-like RCC1 family protein
MKSILAAALFLSLAAARHGLADPSCNCPGIQALAASTQITQFQNGDRFNLAILPDGGVRCWGSRCPGFPSAPTNATAVAAGYNHALILHTNGTLEQFVGAGSSVPPVPAAAQTGVVAIAAGYTHSLALLQSGAVVAWGAPGDGNATVPTDAQSHVSAIASGSGFSLALRDDGRVVQWNAASAVPPEASSDIVAIGGGFASALAVTSGGKVVEWDIVTGKLNPDVPAAALSDVVAVAGGLVHSLALRSDGTVVAWGNTLSAGCAPGIDAKECGEEPAYGYPFYATLDLGDNTEAWAHLPACWPFPLKAGAVRSIAAGGYRSLALLNDGTVVGWGDPVGYPLPSLPGHDRFDPPVPLDLVGPHCINGLTGIRVLRQTIPLAYMGQYLTLDIAIDKAIGSQVPVGITLLDAADNGVSAAFKFATGSAYSTTETKGTLILHVDDPTPNFPPGTRYVLPTGLRTLRLLARSGDITVETSFTIDVRPPLAFQVIP